MTDPTFPPISRQQLAVLAYLAEVWPVASPQVEVAVGAGFETRRTAKKYLDALAEQGLAEYYTCLRGFAITDLGKQLIEFTKHKDCAQITHTKKQKLKQ